MPRIAGYREERRGNWWDSFDLSLAKKDQRIFGGENIDPRGNFDLCNLLIAGNIAYDQTAILNHWYARTALPRTADFDLWAHTAIVTLMVGDRPAWRKPMFDLLREGPWVPPHRHRERMTQDEAADMVKDHVAGLKLQVVPVRQNISVLIESNSDALAVAARGIAVEQGRPGRLARLASRIWVHLEGVSRRDVP